MSKLVNITGVVHTQLSQIWKKEYTNMDALALGYNWHTLATKIAKFTPPKKPTTLEYTPLLAAHNLSALKAILYSEWFVTNFNKLSATRQPAKDFTPASSKPCKIFADKTSKSKGTFEYPGKEQYATSISNPLNSVFNSGTTASGTATIFSVPSCFLM